MVLYLLRQSLHSIDFSTQVRCACWRLLRLFVMWVNSTEQVESKNITEFYVVRRKTNEEGVAGEIRDPQV